MRVTGMHPQGDAQIRLPVKRSDLDRCPQSPTRRQNKEAVGKIHNPVSCKNINDQDFWAGCPQPLREVVGRSCKPAGQTPQDRWYCRTAGTFRVGLKRRPCVCRHCSVWVAESGRLTSEFGVFWVWIISCVRAVPRPGLLRVDEVTWLLCKRDMRGHHGWAVLPGRHPGSEPGGLGVVSHRAAIGRDTMRSPKRRAPCRPVCRTMPWTNWGPRRS